MKYKGIELEGLDKDVKLAHSRFTEADEGTDWIDKLLTCDKAALTPTQFHEVSALSSVINMDHQLARAVGGGYRVDEPKTESGKRYIYMTDEVMAAFEHVVASRPKAKPMSVDGRTGFIFLNRDGLPRVGGDYDRVFRGLRRKYAKGGGAPLPEDMTPHTLRHTFCTEMAKAGMNPKALQYIMGHKDIKMTLGYYAHMDGCTAAKEMRRVAV